MNKTANIEVAKVLRQAADQAENAKSVDELLKLIQKTDKEAKEKVYIYGAQSCLNCRNLERDGNLMSGWCKVRFTRSRWAGDEAQNLYVSQSVGQKCRKFEEK